MARGAKTKRKSAGRRTKAKVPRALPVTESELEPGAKAWLAGAPPIAPGQQDDPRDAEGNYEPDPDRIDEAVLALLVLGLHDGSRAWKGFDWAALDRLHAKGLISQPASRAKSVVFTEEGLETALRSHRLLFAKRPPQSK